MKEMIVILVSGAAGAFCAQAAYYGVAGQYIEAVFPAMAGFGVAIGALACHSAWFKER